MIATIFKDIFSKEPKYVKVDDCLKRICSGKSKNKIEKIRSTNDKEIANKIKSTLPSVCFSGKFGGERTDGSLIEHSGFIVLDFDDVEDLRGRQTDIISHDFVYACWVSPRGNGLKALIRIADGSKHREHFQALKDIFPEVDKSGVNPSRVCYESYDPEIYIYPDAAVFSKIKEESKFVDKVEINHTEEEIFSKLITWINSKGDYFVSGNRNAFVFKLASACCRFGISQESANNLIQHEVSSDQTFTQKECLSAIRSAYKTNRNRFGDAHFTNDVFVEKNTTLEVSIKVPETVITNVPSRIDLTNDDFSFIAKPEDYEEYLTQVRTGTLQMGLTTGMPEMDKHFLFKPADLVIVNGIDNVGKTKIILFLAILSSILHNWKWIIYSSENSLGNIIRTLIEFYAGRKLDKISQAEYEEAKDFVESHFTIIKSEESLFNYRDIINITKKLLSIQRYNATLIDPYNSLKIELNNASKLSTHEYHYEAISEIKMFGKKEDLSIYVNMHAVTSAIRQKDADGYAMAPGKEDTEGGGKFANKADSFLTIHRRTQHPDEWMVTQIFVRKIKEWETGGKPTPLANPLRYAMNTTGVGFNELNEMSGLKNGYDPIIGWKKRVGKIISSNEPDLTWKPYKDDDKNPIGF